MKIKMIDKSVPLPKCWKSCGASYEDWQELQNGKEIEAKSVPDAISSLVSASGAKKKGDK